MNRRQYQIRKQRRREAAQKIVVNVFVAFEIVVGGLSGLLLAAIVLGEGNPIHDAIRDWLVQLVT